MDEHYKSLTNSYFFFKILGMVAYCSADGTVLRFQLTTKAVDKDPSRNRAPIFLCGSLTMDESTVTINTPTTNTPLPLKKSLNKCGDTPIALRDVLSVSNKAKRFDDKMEKYPASNDQTSALCYGDDPEVESEPEETLASLERKKPPNSGSGTEKNLEENLTLVAVDDEPRNTQGMEIVKAGKYELLPSKDVAMHRVRWNMNKGSERWLCYGGAAGLVRCQEIVLSDIDKKWAVKK
ncbi:hypothetical protein L484_000747 [Morus notabilis]|uniref:Uncharacterized protein n=1 Tax=Morus notabilis TaxID=981085 RepID=W9SAP3_9ROSA|nr:hypothetical protein L484_000747 [Morus notabilis]